MIGDRAMAYAVNVDKPTSRAIVHSTKCQYYVNRVPKIAQDGGWSEVYRTQEEALAHAKGTGMRTARMAGGCCPA